MLFRKLNLLPELISINNSGSGFDSLSALNCDAIRVFTSWPGGTGRLDLAATSQPVLPWVSVHSQHNKLRTIHRDKCHVSYF